jgi:SAM-dependent methyltransferase
MTNMTDWQDAVGRSWAENYARTDRSFTGLTERLLDRIRPLPGERVLDIGCGAGELSLAIARARPRAEVVGLDVSANLIAAARMRAGDRTRLRFVEGDAATWHDPTFSPDLFVSRHGVMFFDDPPAAFAHLDQIAAPGAELVFSCFRSPRENPWASGAVELLGLPPGDPDAPGPFAFADPQRVEAILAKGGWQRLDCEPVDFAWIAGVGEDALAFVTRIGPAAPALRAMGEAEREAAKDKLRKWFEDHRNGDLVAFGAAAWIVTAHSNRRLRPR